jgi:Glycosyltransferase WbsX
MDNKKSIVGWLGIMGFLLACTFPGIAPTLLPTSPTLAPTASPTSTATRPPRPNEYIVIAQLNLWYHGTGCYGGFEAFDCSGKRTTPFIPALGATYTSSDPKVIQQQIDWAWQNGVDAFSLEWTTPRGIGGSLEENIDDAFLKAPNLDKIRWCIFYDFILRFMQTPELKSVDFSKGVNFDDEKVYDAFVSDMVHFAKKYYSQSQYLKIDGRPVIYLWSTWSWRGKYAQAIAEARQKVREEGYDVYLVGDVVWATKFDKKLASQFDADSTFTFLLPGLKWNWKNVEQASLAVDKAYGTWTKKMSGLQVAGRQDLVNFQPSFTPQFDNRLFEPKNSIYVPAESREQVIAAANVAVKYAQPFGSEQWKLIWLNTWNNWPEAGTVEPTIDSGPKYPAGNYQFDMLDVVREIFGPETFGQ